VSKAEDIQGICVARGETGSVRPLQEDLRKISRGVPGKLPDMD